MYEKYEMEMIAFEYDMFVLANTSGNHGGSGIVVESIDDKTTM